MSNMDSLKEPITPNLKWNTLATGNFFTTCTTPTIFQSQL